MRYRLGASRHDGTPNIQLAKGEQALARLMAGRTSDIEVKILESLRRWALGVRCSMFSRLHTLGIGIFLCATICACSTPKASRAPTVDPELNRLSLLARSAYDRGAGEEAARLYEKALQRARVMDRPARIGNTAYNLAATLFAIGEYDKARAAVLEARDELQRGGLPATDAWLLEARTVHRQGLLDEAVSLADEALATVESQNEHRYFLELYLLKAQIATEQRDALEARTLLDIALTHSRDSHPKALRARVSEVKGQVLLLEERPGDAGQEFDWETSLLRSSGRYKTMALSLVRAGDAYRKAKLSELSADRYYRAARSMYAQGNSEGAGKISEAALAAAVDAGDGELANKARALMDGIAVPDGEAGEP